MQSLCQDIQTTVGIEYDNDRCGTNYTAPPELNLTLPMGSTALDIMEGAVKLSRSYQFVVTFLGEEGYRIDVINGTSSSKRCQWHLFISEGNETGTLAQLHYNLPSNVTSAVLHYTTEKVTKMIIASLVVICNTNDHESVESHSVVEMIFLQ